MQKPNRNALKIGMIRMAKKNSNLHLFRVPKVETVTGRMDFVLNRCKGKKVLHLGCIDEGLTAERLNSGELLHFKLINVATEVWGVDISKRGIQLLQEHGVDNLVWGNIEQIDEIENRIKSIEDMSNLLKNSNISLQCLTFSSVMTEMTLKGILFSFNNIKFGYIASKEDLSFLYCR